MQALATKYLQSHTYRSTVIPLILSSQVLPRFTTMTTPNSAPKRGAFIVFEGVDRCGKTTQTQKLVQTLNAGNSESSVAQLMRFPDRTTATGKIIDTYLKNGVELDDRAIHLLFASNRWESASKIRSLLEAGVTLIVDRYSYSGVCFTAAKDGQDLEWCKTPEVGLPAPDQVIFLDLPIDQSMQRGAFGEERYEKEDFQKKVYANFKALATSDWKFVDASQSIEDIAQQVESITREVMEKVQEKPIQTLW